MSKLTLSSFCDPGKPGSLLLDGDFCGKTVYNEFINLKRAKYFPRSNFNDID